MSVLWNDAALTHLEDKARWIRRSVLEIGYKIGRAHFGGTFSLVDILVALYYGKLRFSPDPQWKDRDRVFIGKGHASLAVYLILADLEFFDRSALDDYSKNGQQFNIQLDKRIPGVEYNTGSLGNVVGIAAGVAYAAKLDGKSITAYAIIGDGECAEGSIWESLSFAAEQKLDNLIVIVDNNRLSVTAVLDDSLLQNKFSSFGCAAITVDGHNLQKLLDTLTYTREVRRGYPYVIIANTIKGKGVSFMENNVKWHHGTLQEAEYNLALVELQDGAKID